jgi:peptide/nickel transport system substrate-binding protein
LDWRWEGTRTIRFRLDPRATFSDGSPLTAADVRATYESILDPATASPKREELDFLAGIEAPDDHTVVLRLREPFAPLLAATTIGILPRSGLAPRPRELIGAGPFRIAAVRSGRDVRLFARPGRPGIREIRFRVIPDDTVRTLELAKGNLDLVENAVEPDDLRWLERHSPTCVERVPGSTFQYLGLNFRDPILEDLRVRRAIAQAIDRTALVEHLLDGTARVASGLLAPEHWAYEGDVVRYPYDPAAARRLLDEAGYPDPDGPGPRMRLRLSYKTSTLDSRRRMGEALQAMLAAVGIGLDVRGYEWGTFYADIRRGDFELYSLAWVGITDPDFFFTLLHSTMTPPRGNNRGGYADRQIDRLTSLGRETSDLAERRRIYAEVQRLAARDLPFIPLWWTDNVVVRSRRLCGFVPRADGSLESLETAWIDPGKDPDPSRPCRCGPAS